MRISLILLMFLTGCAVSSINKDTGKSWIIGIGEHKQGDAYISSKPLDMPNIDVGSN